MVRNTGRLVAVAVLGLAFVMVPASADAQNKYLGRGTSGFGIGAGFGTGNDVNDLGAAAGYSFNGMVSVGLGFDRLTVDGVDDMSALQFSPFVGVVALKQSEEMPISLEFGGSYLNMRFSGDALDALDWEMSQTGFGFGGSVYGAMEMSETTSLIPDFGISHTMLDLKIEDEFGNSITEDANVTSFSFGAAIAFETASQNVFNMHAGVSIPDEGDAMFGLSLGMVFPAKSTP